MKEHIAARRQKSTRSQRSIGVRSWYAKTSAHAHTSSWAFARFAKRHVRKRTTEKPWKTNRKCRCRWYCVGTCKKTFTRKQHPIDVTQYTSNDHLEYKHLRDQGKIERSQKITYSHKDFTTTIAPHNTETCLDNAFNNSICENCKMLGLHKKIKHRPNISMLYPQH